jgi:hypothetical protein
LGWRRPWVSRRSQFAACPESLAGSGAGDHRGPTGAAIGFWAGQAVAAGGPQAASNSFIHFILALVPDREVGSASGVLNAAQQLASAIGVAAIGTVFFSTLARSGFTAAIRECLMIELGVAVVLFVLARALPRRPRYTQTARDRAGHSRHPCRHQ